MWSSDRITVKLNLGCGNDKREGYINYDKELNLNCKLPFKDNTVDEIIVYHVLEHLIDKEFTINEFYRVLKKNGVLRIKLPINSNVVEHKTGLHGKHYFFKLYGYEDSIWYLEDFRKSRHHFLGSVLGDLKNRFFTWLDLFFYNEYYWELRKK